MPFLDGNGASIAQTKRERYAKIAGQGCAGRMALGTVLAAERNVNTHSWFVLFSLGEVAGWI